MGVMFRAAAIFLVPGLLLRAVEPTGIWRHPGRVDTLNLAAGPGGNMQPVQPFFFVKEEGSGTAPKVVVRDRNHRKWMVKFGDEAKPENFASRIAWAAGYIVRPSYYVAAGQLFGAESLKRAGKFVDAVGRFQSARFQLFDDDDFHEIPGRKFDLDERREDQQKELSGLKLTLLLVANWDVKTGNTGVFAIGNRTYAAVTDWGASMGDPAAVDARDRKWNCPAYSARTHQLVAGVTNGFVQFNYTQYASRHEHALGGGIRLQHLKWFVDRMSRLTDVQVRAALSASGATPAEAACFTTAFRQRHVFVEASGNQMPDVRRSRTVKTTVRRAR